MMGDITENFSWWEFESPDAPGVRGIRIEFVERLQLSRDISGIAYIVSSGWRTPKHHSAIYEALGVSPAPNSAHPDGWASDLVFATSYRAHKMMTGLLQVGFPRIIVYSNFIHVDMHPDAERFPQPMLKRGAY